jgi:tRNA-2-methylthio-N6-dimethylallyladenosine synthase
MIGREVSVLFEKLGRDEGQMVGKSEYLHAVHVANANAQVGDIAKVRIVDAGTNSLRGEILL